MIRVVLAGHLRALARVDARGRRSTSRAPATQRSRARRARGPLSDAARDDPRPVTQRRRPFVRFFACERDLSHEPPDAPLPEAVAAGAEPFLIVGAMAGG